MCNNGRNALSIISRQKVIYSKISYLLVRVQMKKTQLDQVKSVNQSGLSGQSWYQLQTTRAINQSIGRIIRNKNDFGCILFFDERYSWSNNFSQIASWVQKRTEKIHDFEILLVKVAYFFKVKKEEQRKRLTQQPKVTKKFIVKEETKEQQNSDQLQTQRNKSMTSLLAKYNKGGIKRDYKSFSQQSKVDGLQVNSTLQNRRFGLRRKAFASDKKFKNKVNKNKIKKPKKHKHHKPNFNLHDFFNMKDLKIGNKKSENNLAKDSNDTKDSQELATIIENQPSQFTPKVPQLKKKKSTLQFFLEKRLKVENQEQQILEVENNQTK